MSGYILRWALRAAQGIPACSYANIRGHWFSDAGPDTSVVSSSYKPQVFFFLINDRYIEMIHF